VVKCILACGEGGEKLGKTGPKLLVNSCLQATNWCEEDHAAGPHRAHDDLPPCTDAAALYEGCYTNSTAAPGVTVWRPTTCSLAQPLHPTPDPLVDLGDPQVTMLTDLLAATRRDLWIYMLGDSGTRGL
jgi:hypothetical protein